MTDERRSHARREYPMVGVREFRDTFPDLHETVRVIRNRKPIEVLGTWTPNKQRTNSAG